MDNRGVTLIELIVVLGIIAILASIAVPTYVGQQKRAARAEAFSNLESLRLLEEQFFAENGKYAPTTGTCAKDNTGNIALINQDPAILPGFRPGSGSTLGYSYCIILNASGAATGATGTPAGVNPTASACFRAAAYGNTGSRVDGDIFWIDCNNNKNY